MGLWHAPGRPRAVRVKIATWNVNSIRVRQDLVLDWLRRTDVDVLCMQETKVVDDDFPTDGFQRLGYAVAMAGQKSYNGVAIASRLPMHEIAVGLVDDDADADKRAISATIAGVRVTCVYVPNGKSPLLPAFRQKLEWFARLRRTLEAGPGPDADVLVCGDFNVAREARDVYDPVAMAGHLHFHPDEHQAFDQLLAFGLVDAYRMHHEEAEKYSWWDYRGPSVRRNQGLRIDYVLCSRELAKRCSDAWMDADERLADKPSDHIPVTVALAERA